LEKFVGTNDDGWGVVVEHLTGPSAGGIGVLLLEPGSKSETLLLELWRKQTGEVIRGWPARASA
jgi:hypothetical protein